MKIIQQRDKLLSNFEVYQHIVDVQKENSWGFTIPKVEKKRKQKFDPRLLDLEIITRDLSQYLVKMDQGNEVKTENFVNLMLVLNTFELEVIEKLMIMNSLPRSLVNLYAIIEECEGRFSQDQCEDMLQNVERYFPAPVNEEEEEADEGEEIEEDFEMQDSGVHVAMDEEENDDEAAFVQADEFEHEGFKKKQNEEKEIDEVES